MKKVAVLVEDGTEELEAIGVIDILRRASIEVEIVSMVNKRKIKGANGITIFADSLFRLYDFSTCDMLIIPGGKKAVDLMKNNQRLITVIRDFDVKQKYIAAICAAPCLLSQADILRRRTITCYPSVEPEIDCEKISSEPLVVDHHIITAKSVAYTIDFALTLVEVLYGVEKRNEVADKIIFARSL